MELIGCAWIAAHSFEESDLGIRFELKSDEVWLYAAVVDSEYRRRGVYRQLLNFLLDELAQTNVSRIVLAATHGNIASIEAHESHGAIKAGTVIALRSLGVSFCATSGRVLRLSPGPASLRWITLEVQ